MIVNLGAGVEHIVLQAGHSVMVSKPRALAAIINDAVERCARRTSSVKLLREFAETRRNVKLTLPSRLTNRAPVGDPVPAGV
jgi:hypothetical protein